MFDLEQIGQWFAYLSYCRSNNVFSEECTSRWSLVLLAGFVVGLLVMIFAGYIFYRENRKYQRTRSRLRARDVAALEEIADEQSGEASMRRVLARKYRDLIEKSGLSGWRIFGDKSDRD